MIKLPPFCSEDILIFTKSFSSEKKVYFSFAMSAKRFADDNDDNNPSSPKAQKSLTTEPAEWVEQLAAHFSEFTQESQESNGESFPLLAISCVSQLSLKATEEYFNSLPEDPTVRAALHALISKSRHPETFVLLPAQKSDPSQKVFKNYSTAHGLALYEAFFDNLWQFLMLRTSRIRYFRCVDDIYPLLCAFVAAGDALNAARLVLWERKILPRYVQGPRYDIMTSTAVVVSRFLFGLPLPSPNYSDYHKICHECMFYDVFVARPCSTSMPISDFGMATSEYQEFGLPFPPGRDSHLESVGKRSVVSNSQHSLKRLFNNTR